MSIIADNVSKDLSQFAKHGIKALKASYYKTSNEEESENVEESKRDRVEYSKTTEGLFPK
jgi:hypothetical protein